MLGSFGVPGAERCTLVPVCITWLPCGYELFWLRTGTFWGFPCTLVSEFLG